jgi:glyoxylase-like metal-dependent hydrolase (beta-lactamase superfamily II)
MLSEMNIAPDAITDIVLTHAHFDHMGSIAEFPSAHIYIQKSELLSWYEAFALPRRFAHLTAIVDPDNIRSALDASIAHRVTLIDGDKDNVLPGIHVRLGSGHTIGQQFVVIETKAGRWVISGDCVYSRRQFTGHNNDGVYVPLNNAVGSVWEQLKTIDKMNDELGGDLTRLVVLHDIERWKGHQVVKEVEGFRIVEIK